MSALERYEEVLALSAEDFGIWLEAAEQESEPLELEHCPWILMPSSLAINKNLSIIPRKDLIVPVKWKIGNMAVYVFAYDGDNTVKAYVTVGAGDPELSILKISQIEEIMLITDTNDYLRMSRDTSWTTSTLGDLFPELFTEGSEDEELVF